MNTDHMIRWYERLLGLYPSSFRAAFGEELQSVFAESLNDAARCGDRAAWQCFLRELLDLPFNLLREYFSGQGFNALIERLLTHKKRTRWQQAGALGFMLGFALLELLNGLPQILDRRAYISWFGWVKAKPGDWVEPPSGTDWRGLVCVAAAGLLAGWVFSLAERQGGWRLRLRAALAGAAAMLAPYLIFFITPDLLHVSTKGWTFTQAAAINVAKIAWIITSIGGLPPVVLGLLLGGQTPGAAGSRLPQIRALFGAGLAGVILGYISGFFTTLALGLVILSMLSLIPGIAVAGGEYWQRYLALNCLLAMVASGVMGRVYGGWVGREIGILRQGTGKV